MPDLVHHLQRRCLTGICIVVVDKPELQLAVLRKEWLRGEYQVERQAASTLGDRRITLIQEHQRLQTVHFKSALRTQKGHVLLAGPEDAASLPETYTTLYLLTALSDAQLSRFTSYLSRGGLIVRYEITDK